MTKSVKYAFMTIAACLGILAAMFVAPEVPEMLTHRVQKLSVVKQNMRTCAISAGVYAEKHSGCYPKTVNDDGFSAYFVSSLAL
jgi:hypothetical protein